MVRTLGVVLTWVQDRRHLLQEALLLAVVGFVTVVGTYFASQNQPDRNYGVAGALLLGAGVVSLAFRNRFPAATLAAAVTFTLTYWSLGYARGPVFLPMIVALVTVVFKGRRVAAITALVVGFVGFPWLPYLLDDGDRPAVVHMVALAAWLVALISITETVRYRRDRAEAAALSQTEALRRRETEERLRIARELHDVVAHNMSLISLQAGVALHLMDQQPEQARTSLTTIKQASKDALVELRSILGVLRQIDEAGDDGTGAAPRAPTPSLEGLGDLVDKARAAGVDVQVERDGVGDDVPRPVGLAAYRIVQESLTNVAKHSSDPRAVVRLHLDDGGLVVEVLDEGLAKPTPHNGTVGGHGIVGMRERVAQLGGSLDVGPRAGRGFAVRAWLPLEEDT